MTGLIGVAISTTGDEHRLPLLRQCVQAWRRALPLGAVLVVTVDGTEEHAQRVRQVVNEPQEGGHAGGTVWRVGQPGPDYKTLNHRLLASVPRLGVAANKNTGIEMLMEAGAEHLFLCDDDTWPLYYASLFKHIDFSAPHSMVMWGRSRFHANVSNPTWSGIYAQWTWPRGVLLYARRSVILAVGGMDERFGIGGHEHAEWSQRIHNAGLTPAPFISPVSYTTRNYSGAAALWHVEDMPRSGESSGSFQSRKRHTTTIRREDRDWDRIHAIMAEREGSADFVAYEASQNGRASATLCTAPSRGAGGEK
jgi:GT2 family glycosyltransferase